MSDTATIPDTTTAQVPETRIATYHLTGTVQDIRDSHGLLFDADTYSKMKHGDSRALRNLGRGLADTLREQAPALFTSDADVVLPVAYMAVTPSCYHLAAHVRDVLNDTRIPAGLTPARIVRISKDSVTTTDYAASTAAEREAEMASISFTLDEPIDGTHVVLVDDVRITGLAERTAVAAMADQAPLSMTLGYVAVVDEGLIANPHVESVMNHATVTRVTDMLPSIAAGEFVLTIRFLKRVLGAPAADLDAFVAGCPTAVLEEMLAGAAATGPAFVASYATGLATIETEVAGREH